VPEPFDTDQEEKLRQFEARLSAAKKDAAPKPHIKKDYAQAQLAWRMVIELVAGLLIGFAMGYGLDLLIGTTPLFMVIFIGLGFAAGIKTMLRTARELNNSQKP
jgi:ATP synthase protein I